MPHSQNPKPRHVRPEVIARLRRRIQQFSLKEHLYSHLLAARALYKTKGKIDPIKMAEQNLRTAIFAKKYKIALQLVMRREGIENKLFYDEMNSLLFDLARTPETENRTHHQQIIIERIEKTLLQHGIEPQKFYEELEKTVRELNAE